MWIFLFSCTHRTMVAASTQSLQEIEPELQVSTQHFFLIPAGPSFKGRWSPDHKQLSFGTGVGLIWLLPQRSRWFVHPPTIGIQWLDWHQKGRQSYWGTLSPYVQLTAPPICVSPKGCFLLLSPFVEYEYSNILGAENHHNWSLGVYWSTAN